MYFIKNVEFFSVTKAAFLQNHYMNRTTNPKNEDLHSKYNIKRITENKGG